MYCVPYNALIFGVKDEQHICCIGVYNVLEKYKKISQMGFLLGILFIEELS